jgi:predicted nucleotide-binding protein (sugar kinase/HSP70/actin superfamily)
MYAENQEIFSYTPCKPFNEETKIGFPRVIFPYENLGGFQFSNNPTGIKIISSNTEQTKEVWQFITQEVLNQGYCLGVKIDEPKQ